MLSFISILAKFSPQSCHSEERGISLRNLSVMEGQRSKGSKGQRLASELLRV
jgi:hypothetical protein